MAEYWDLYDREGNRTGEVHLRGEAVPEGRYHLVINVWTRNRAGEYLLTQRHPDKAYPLWWEITGGSVLAGEDSETGARRELLEELGLEVRSGELEYLGNLIIDEDRSIYDTYLLRRDAAIAELKLQPGEVVAARWADEKELRRTVEAGRFVQRRGYRTWFADDGRAQ